MIYSDMENARILDDDDTLIFSSLSGLAKFGHKPSNKESKERLEKLFSSGEQAKFNVHYSCATRRDDNIVIAHINRIENFKPVPEYNFNAKQTTQELIEWVRNYFAENGFDSKAVIGISGGKDSSVVAKLCVEALGADRVVGVLMPCGEQSDISYSHELCELLGIENVTVNIEDVVDAELRLIESTMGYLTNQTKINVAPRVRMMTLYAVAQNIGNCRVSNNCNLSETYIGFSTIFGDTAGAFSPIKELTTSEVVSVGYELGLSDKFLVKEPSDGLTGKTDEDAFGFTYEVLNKYIRYGICDDIKTKSKIDKLHEINKFKSIEIPRFKLRD